eukprot:SAG31_NODE_13139_length_890_cov_1.671302_1_plen_114_part_10
MVPAARRAFKFGRTVLWAAADVSVSGRPIRRSVPALRGPPILLVLPGATSSRGGEGDEDIEDGEPPRETSSRKLDSAVVLVGAAMRAQGLDGLEGGGGGAGSTIVGASQVDTSP